MMVTSSPMDARVQLNDLLNTFHISGRTSASQPHHFSKEKLQLFSVKNYFLYYIWFNFKISVGQYFDCEEMMKFVVNY